MQQRSPVTIVLLGFVTCGIYHLIWMHQVGEENACARGGGAADVAHHHPHFEFLVDVEVGPSG
ncbi:MAG TPA: DUF4234 domain-containing protein [Polyangiaceae bacterium]|nr:DUF4234 domain-containing protein [Polyangiaceae bacterium]